MASLRRVLRVAKQINNELKEASGVSIRGSRGGGGGARMTIEMAGIRQGVKRIERAVKGSPAEDRRHL